MVKVRPPKLLLAAAGALVALLGVSSPAWSASGYGKLSGTVLDTAGKPQMGATIWLTMEALDGDPPAQLQTNQTGIFNTAQLRPGFYSVRVTLAGFLPTIEQHIRVRPDLTTLVRVEMTSVLASIDQLRHPPAQPTENDDWKWVLRSASATRPILQWRNGTVVRSSESPDTPRPPRVEVSMTTGGSPAGSSYIAPNAPATAVSYDQPLGPAGRLLVAGQMIYGQTADAGGSLASIWLPSGELGRGPETTVVVRQGPLGLDGRLIRQMRAEHTEQTSLGDNVVIEYGAEYLLAGMQSVSSSVRPHGRILMRVSPHWKAAFSVETEPDSYALRNRGSSLDSALDALDTLPQRVWDTNGRAVIAGGWHEELAVRRDLGGSRGSLQVAAFHDYSDHTAVYGVDSGVACSVPQNCTPWMYAHDGGVDSSWGTRAVYQQKITNNLQVAAIYAWAGAMALGGVDPNTAIMPLEARLQNKYVQSVAGRVSGKLPRLQTQLSASYKWVGGQVVTRQDAFGEAAMGMDPNLGLNVRQPLPGFRSTTRWEAVADFRNILAQGYLSVVTPDGQTILVPVARSFRGGVSFQF